MLLGLIIPFNLTYAKTEEAIFAGGDFKWLEADFNQLPGVLVTTTGFEDKSKSSYQANYLMAPEHLSAIKVIYNPQEISYSQLVDFFWHHIDPTNNEGQFCDNGPQYRSAIFYANNQQRKIAVLSKARMKKKFAHIYTLLLPNGQFYAADENAQGYYREHYLWYKFSRFHCGRDKTLAEIWK